MDSNRTIRSIHLEKLLSFGEGGATLELHPLNVLIGPNASGKSNLIEAFRILHAAPEDVKTPIREGGGIKEYVWKGGQHTLLFPNISVTVSWEEGSSPIYYSLTMADFLANFGVLSEEIKLTSVDRTGGAPEYIYRRVDNGRAELYSKQSTSTTSFEAAVKTQFVRNEIGVVNTHSILSQYKDPSSFPSLFHLQMIFSSIRFYTGWNLGRYGALRYPQKADIPSTTLLEDGSNLGLVLINKPASVRHEITEQLKTVFPTVEEIFPKLEGGTVPLYIREKGFSTPTPAARLSEGTLRYLCLLTLLLDPTPPPLICLEEPDVGLHPDVIHTIADLLIDASQRTQLIVTTHSDKLISALANAGATESVVVCERQAKGTLLHRLDPKRLKKWLDKYSLGELWAMGEIGGTRW